MKKEKRLNLILTVIQQNQFNKKQQIVDYMARHFGVYYSLTTICLTTISRDLQELEIYKIPVENKKYIYKKINQTNQLSAKKQLEIFSDEIIEFITLNNYVLIKTSPGFAQSISYYIDQLQMKEILGTIGGNDTLMILTSSNEIAEFVCYQLFP
ncbi:ArgR family transcriptional regulator [Staphylococcus epidermidis]|uniref:arginine repressor n=1 Tax=Staphylococcus epidermidis TaxID=1282 RepID=UPI00209679FD|nr:ArgR family transcriptional regulator [Staphylococcus epidermidis]MCG2175279.1 ArgR family transcriptional regulator [Staphylococcus epidermidis]MCG2305683.1 ArgR family transcriptional regulator [Staphylococcus epidermidis]MCO6238429.1 ArgR family transcriptional regulator [Staphylococcus epidermidis]